MNDHLIYLSPPDKDQQTISFVAINSGAGVALLVETLRDQFPRVNDLRPYLHPTGSVLIRPEEKSSVEFTDWRV